MSRRNSSVKLTLNDLWWPCDDQQMTDFQNDNWELDKLSRKINRCDPHRCTIWKWFLLRQDWIWPLTTYWVKSGHLRSCSINPRWQITIPIKGKYRSFAVLKGNLFIFIIKTTCFCTWTSTRVCSDMWGHLVYRASDPKYFLFVILD